MVDCEEILKFLISSVSETMLSRKEKKIVVSYQDRNYNKNGWIDLWPCFFQEENSAKYDSE